MIGCIIFSRQVIILFGFKIFVNSATTGQVRFGIYKNGVLLGFGGAYAATGETLDLISYCNVGEYISVECASGSAVIYVAPSHSWFYGHKLQPENNTVSVTTDLTVANLNASTVNGDISNNLAAGSNITLNTTNGITTISAAAGLTHPLNISTINVSVAANISTATISTLTVQAQMTAGNVSFTNISASGDLTVSTINTSLINSSHVNIYNASVEQTFEFAPGSTFKMDNSVGDSVFLYNDSTRFNYGTVATTTDMNFGSGYNASTIQIKANNVINMENAAGVNILNTSINNSQA